MRIRSRFRSLSLFLLAAAWLSAGCGSRAPSAPPTGAGGTQAPAGPVTPSEVVIIGTQHFISDMPDGYTPAHLRALLTKIKPDVVAVEAPTNVPDPWPFAPYDVMKVTKPWADEHQIRLAPAGWLELSYQLDLAGMFRAYQEEGKTAAYQAVEQAFQVASSQQPGTCAFMNCSAYQDLWRSYHQKLHDLYGGDTPWETWNAKILANVEKICREHPGKRVAVVFGGAHGYYLADRLGQNPEITVVDTAKFFPLSDEEVAANTTKMDYLQSLRPLNFPAVLPQQLPQLAAALDQVKEVAEYEGDYHLFHGKLLLHQGRFAEAQDEFAKLAETSGDSVSVFDGQSLLREGGSVYAAVAKSKQGHFAEARADFDAVLAAPGTKAATKQWIEQLKLELAVAEKAADSLQAVGDEEAK
ncbi:MAG TPA: hypothetical protein VG125_25240 [Pirellulales bacterium]|jgi:tetratricopeptide (TPR) repeat protein|nr:hypothetical protein [Pirellulales bacterium]